MSSEVNTGRVINMGSGGGVRSFNGRRGAVMPKAGDYSAQDVGAVPAGRQINGKPLSGDITLTHTDVGAVPDTRKVNGKPLNVDISLTPSDVGAVAATEKGKPGGVATLDSSGMVSETQLPSLCPFVAGTSAPSDTKKLWIDTTANTGGLKYWNGSAWVTVPVAYT